MTIHVNPSRPLARASGRAFLRGPDPFWRADSAPVAPPVAPFGPALPRPIARPRALPDVPAARAPSAYETHGKRALDLLIAGMALLLAAPVLALLALALWLEGGNPFFSQPRLGRNGRLFRMWKLRSMVPGAERKLAAFLAADPALRREWELTQKLKRDPRITPLGRLLRMTSLDELPQLWNVIRGDMSMVGPRPMLPEQLPLYRHPEDYTALRPGITGLWQVSARNESSFALRADIDRHYRLHLSLRDDLKIIGATFGAVVNGTGY